jgi:hypothetical protein
MGQKRRQRASPQEKEGDEQQGEADPQPPNPATDTGLCLQLAAKAYQVKVGLPAGHHVKGSWIQSYRRPVLTALGTGLC